MHVAFELDFLLLFLLSSNIFFPYYFSYELHIVYWLVIEPQYYDHCNVKKKSPWMEKKMIDWSLWLHTEKIAFE